jgi:hypothetical protein
VQAAETIHVGLAARLTLFVIVDPYTGINLDYIDNTANTCATIVSKVAWS